MTCSVCKRAVLAEHVDADGRCVLCAPKPAAATTIGTVKTPPATAGKTPPRV